ncbi:unnamed protein product [Clonostachys rosea]|uniref:Xylanolytic transcriptional activator regulatory domain-containing protein n=1 Tax=Bionectria ochroleuca TaxID=29856 RepID=A0ABY6UNS0_BIOOC|nr:unnamed protein product [Clonostachys rosea]
MRSRLAAVEAKVGMGSSDSLPEGDENVDFQESGLAGAMEDAAFDIGQVRRWQDNNDNSLSSQPASQRSSRKWYGPMPFNACVAALPSRPDCDWIVEAFLQDLNWFCGCLHAPSIRRAYDEFWKDGNDLQDGMFLSVLFAILSNSAFLLSDERLASAPLEMVSIRDFASLWFDCSFASFHRCDGLAEPSLTGLQAMIVLNYAFHLSGNSKTHRSMFAINIGTARAINLHLLGSQMTGSVEDVLRRELGRRAWWTLVETEWYFTPYHRYSYVAPHQFDTSLPSLTDDGSATALATTNFTSLTYLLFTSRSSRVLYDLYGTLQPYQNPSYDAVLAASNQLDTLYASFLQLGAQSSPHSPTHYARRVIGMSLAYRSYLVHRAYFVKSLSDKSFSQTHSACVDAARTILSFFDEGIPSTFYRLWNVTIWLVAAGLILALDLVKASSDRRAPVDAPARRSRLAALVSLLTTLADQSGIGIRGAKLIRHLCSMESDIMAGRRPSLAGITRQEIIRLVQSCRRSGGETDSGEIATASTPVEQRAEGFADYDAGNSNSENNMVLDTGDLDEFMFLPSSWAGNDDLDTMQLSFNIEGTEMTERDHFLDFFADLRP